MLKIDPENDPYRRPYFGQYRAIMGQRLDIFKFRGKHMKVYEIRYVACLCRKKSEFSVWTTFRNFVISVLKSGKGGMRFSLLIYKMENFGKI